MKKAFQYIRKSDEEQSNFSISGQQLINEEWARKNKIEIIGTYIDDGYSAKDFNRPQWKQLEKDLPKSKVDFLIVMKYDRLIRNVIEGLTFVEKLEQKWNITLLSVMENYSIDIYDPYFFKMRADMFVDADFERRRISDRTKFGIWSGKTQGRYLGPAPYGYINDRGEDDKPVILVEESKKSIIEGIFTDFLNDLPLATIKLRAQAKGFDMKGKESVKRVILNHTYAGLIQVRAYKDSVKKVVKGLHEGVISEDTFWTAYYKLINLDRTVVLHQHDINFPLRGFLTCELCDARLTGSKTKGRNAYYYYYLCNTDRGRSFSAPVLHDRLIRVLSGLSLKLDFVEAIIADTEMELSKTMDERKSIMTGLTREKNDLQEQLTSLEGKYILNKISEAVYNKWHETITTELREKSIMMDRYSTAMDTILAAYTQYLPYLTDLSFIYEKAAIEDKHLFLKGIFPAGLSPTKTGYRTAYVTHPFQANDPLLKDLLEVKNNGEPAFYSKFPERVVGGSPVEPFGSLLRIVEKIIKAAAA